MPLLCRSNPETFSVAENYDAVKVGASPESITTICGYGFRAPSLRSGPGMTAERLPQIAVACVLWG